MSPYFSEKKKKGGKHRKLKVLTIPAIARFLCQIISFY